MLMCPKTPLICIVGVVLWNISFNNGDWTFIYCLLNKLITTKLGSLVHGLNHLFSDFHIIDFAYPGSHNMHSTEDNITLLLTILKILKSFSKTFGFYTTLISKKILKFLVTFKLLNYCQGLCNSVTVFFAHEKVCTNIPTSILIMNI